MNNDNPHKYTRLGLKLPQPYIQFTITAGLFLFLYFPLVPQLINEWASNEDYSHGFIVFLIIGYFLWRKRDELKNTPVIPSPVGLLFILAGVGLYFAANLGYQFFLQCVSMLVVILGLVYAQAGWSMTKRILFPVFYSLFIIPLPQVILTTITFHLRLFSTKIAFFAIKFLGIKATMEGNIIQLPVTTLVVANPCSGLRSLITFMAASLAIGYLFQKSFKNRAVLFVFSILLAIAMNTLRLVLEAVIAYAFKMESVGQSLDSAVGIVVLIIGAVILLALNNILEKIK